MKRNFLSVALSVVVSFVFVFVVVNAASTISTNISTGGTLSVTGASTLTGLASLNGNASTTMLSTTGSLWVNGYATTTGSTGAFATQGSLTVAGATILNGGLTMDSTAFTVADATGNTAIAGTLDVTGKTTLGNASTTILTVSGNTYLATTTMTSGGSLTLGTLAADPSGPANGQMYYSTASNAVRIYQNGVWGALSNTADGWTDNGATVNPSTMADQFLIGTTSPSGLSQLTVEATSTAGIPLTLRGYNGQTANLFRIQNVASSNLFTIDSLGRLGSTLDINGYATTTTAGNFSTLGTVAASSTLQVTGATTLYSTLALTGLASLNGNASTTHLSMTGNLWVNGNATTTSAGNISTQGNLTILGTASTSALKVGDEPAAPTINGMVFGYCSFADVTSFTASTTKFFDCTTTPAGALLAGDRVFVQATSSFDSMYVIQAASTTGVSTINIRALNTGLDGVADATLNGTSINFWAVR